MLDKKIKKEGCPFRNLKECSEKCALYRRGTRFNEATNEVTPIEICAFNVIADNIERMHHRTFALQQEMGETKNVMAFHVMADLGMTTMDEAERQAKKILIPIIEKMDKKELPEK